MIDQRQTNSRVGYRGVILAEQMLPNFQGSKKPLLSLVRSPLCLKNRT